ncbi:hypothetical protein TSPI_11147, partial [Trichinella spiralis]
MPQLKGLLHVVSDDYVPKDFGPHGQMKDGFV